MLQAGAVTLARLAEAGERYVYVVCAKCGCLMGCEIEQLLGEYVELSPISFLESVTLGCERRIAADPSDPCAAIYAGLEALPTEWCIMP